VKILGDKVIIGEAGADVEPMQYEGKVHVYGVDGELVQTLTAPSPTPRGAFGWYIDAEGDMLVISEVWAEVEGSDDCGKVYLYKLGAPVEVQEPLEEITNEVEEAEIEPSRGIPGFPLLSILVALVVYYFIRERV
jgi:hypothetical protein